MTPMRFFIMNGIILLLLVLYIFKKRPKSRFRLRMTRLRGALAPEGGSGSGVVSGAVGADAGSGAEKTLNTLFNYNGHTWDAYEVLGLPAGSSLSRVDEAYKDCVEKQASSRDFLDAAYQAIRAQKIR